MDDLERRLRDDAAQIRADVPADLQARIGASLRTARPMPPAPRESGWPLWLAAGLTGAAAAVVALVAFRPTDPGMNPGVVEDGPQVADSAAYSVPQYVSELERQFPLRVTTADLTAPLEEEMKKLRADLERARENVEEDLDFTF
jgi:hypothetical protein